MAITPKALSRETLDKDALLYDKKNCIRFGPCGVGGKALYLNSFYFDRIYYIPFRAVKRVFKRVAMSKGGFTGRGAFASMPYLVVVFDGGTERQFLFKHEEHVDEMLDAIHIAHPAIPLLSEVSEQRRMERLAEEAAKPHPEITKEAKQHISELEAARDYLDERPALYSALTQTAKAKRVNERSNPAYRWAALAIVLMGVAAAAYGVWAIVTDARFGIYFTLFGLAAVFLFSGANVLPTKRNNKAYVDAQWQKACENMDGHIGSYKFDFPVPARYAHPVTLTRMIRIITEARAEDETEALEVLKSDLKALNADVQVYQEEYDEIMAIKPMFLVEAYR